MKKREVAKIVCFLLIFLFLLRSVSYITRTNGDVKDRFMGFYAEQKDTIDVVLLGSSRVYPCYATPMMYGEAGITAYALSTNIQRPKTMYYLVKEALKTQSPALFVMDVQMFLQEDAFLSENMAYTRGVTDNMKYSLNRVQAVNALVPEGERLSYHLDIFKYHSNWRTMALIPQLKSFRYEVPAPFKGHSVRDSVGRTDRTDVTGVTGRAPIPAEQEETLRALCAFLSEGGHDALFVATPALTNAEECAGHNYIADVVAEYGFTFLNLNLYYDEIGLDFARDYADEGNHTNARGAEKVTRFFNAYLREHYDLPDRRENGGLRSWDEAYERWKSAYGEALVTIDARIGAGDYWQPEDVFDE